jgi:peptide/nickel transport system ATP-binding protein/oligopeptide transport system ATP-binding protein
VDQENRLLELKSLKTWLYTKLGIFKAVDGVSFDIAKGKTQGVVGESGCGKSMTALSIMGLIPVPPAKIVGGQILYYMGDKIIDLSKLDPKGQEMGEFRGNEISMIFQDPMTSLNPVYTIGSQISEAIRRHQRVNKKGAKEKSIEMLQMVGMPLPAQRVNEYPHQLSGGMRQRAMIAMALSCNPKLLIADEPTTALDVTIQAQILQLTTDLQDESGMSIMMITHDLGIIAETADDVAVMYLGKIIESADVRAIFHNPLHPYLIGLLESKPTIDARKDELVPIEGVVPEPLEMVWNKKCGFAQRCSKKMEICEFEEPREFTTEKTHKVKCWLYA